MTQTHDTAYASILSRVHQMFETWPWFQKIEIQKIETKCVFSKGDILLLRPEVIQNLSGKSSQDALDWFSAQRYLILDISNTEMTLMPLHGDRKVPFKTMLPTTLYLLYCNGNQS